MSDRVLSCTVRCLAGTTLACALALLLAPVHAADDSASAVLHVRSIDTQSAVRSVRGIGSAQQNPVIPVQAGIPASVVMPAQAGIQIADAAGFPSPTHAFGDDVPARERRSEIAGVAASHAAHAGVLPSVVMPAQAGIQTADATGFPSPTHAFGDDVPARERRAEIAGVATSHTAPARERQIETSADGSGSPSTYSQPLLASVQQAQQPAPSAVVAQSEIGAGNNILLPRAWYDTTPGRIGIFIGASAVASLADRGVKDWALRHQNDAFNRDVIKARDILPWPAFWLAAATSFPSPWANDKLAHTSTVALGAGVLDSVETLALKAVIGRDRPADSNNPYNFTPFNPRYGLIYGGSSFPSGHTSLTWALITPYARAYHMPWLYALGVASGAGRVMQNAHWFSDVVGGGLLGYFTARWTEQHMNSKANMQWVFTGNGLYMFKSF